MLCAATLAAALVPTAGLAAPGEAARPRVVVVNAVDLPDSLADIRAQLRTTLNDAVTKHGYDLAPEAGSCADRECLKVAAVSAGASDVLVATGGRNDMRGYHVELRIWNVASDREDNAVAECNICAAQQMVDNVQNAADPLLDRVPTLHANLSANAVPPAVTVEPAPGAVPLVAAPDQVPETKSRHRWLGWTLIGAGVAAGAASGILIAIDGSDFDNCLHGASSGGCREMPAPANDAGPRNHHRRTLRRGDRRRHRLPRPRQRGPLRRGPHDSTVRSDSGRSPVRVRWLSSLALLATAAFSCAKLNQGRCDQNGDCDVQHGYTCNPMKYCAPGAGGTGGTGGLGGVGGAAGSKGTGGTPFACPNSKCSGNVPICDMDAGACEACSTNNACMKLSTTTPFCAPASDGGVSAPKGTCVGCLTSTNCVESVKPICDTKTWTCAGCETSDACKALNLSTPICVTATDASANPKIGMCVGCLSNANCGGLTPICNLSTNVCTACGSDTDCSAVGPGVCMTDGHCAGTTEVFFVEESAGCSGTGTGSSATPFCSLNSGAGALAKGQNVLVILGAVGERLVLATPQISPVIIGRQNAAGDAAVIPASNGAAIAVSSDTVLIRDITVSGGLQSSNTRGVLATGSAAVSLLRVTVNLGNGLGVDAETGTTLSMDRCYVENNSLGGILVNGAMATIQNSVIAKNGGTTGYGIQFNAPGTTQFTFNTVADNPTAAISDLSHQVLLNNSIVAGPTTNCPPTNSFTGTMVPAFSSTNPYHLTAQVGCPAAPQSPIPPYDIDGQPRVAPIDCGADQFSP